MPSSTHLPVLLTQCFEPLCLHSGPLGHLLSGYPTRYVLEVSPHENTAVIAATVNSLQSRPSLDVFAASVVCRGSGVASGGVWYPPNASLPIPGEEDECVPLCDTHATLSTEAGLHAHFKAYPPLESAGALIRGAMGAAHRVTPGNSTLLVLAVEAADHLFEGEDEEEASLVAPVLKTLCEWSQCHECWAKATGDGGPPAALILTATHAPAIPSSVWALPGKAPNLFLPPHTLNSLIKALGSESTGKKEGGSSSSSGDGLQSLDHSIAGRGVANTLPFLYRVAQKKEGWGGVRGRGDDGSGGNQGPLSLDIWMSLPFTHPSSTTITTATQEEEESTVAIAATQSSSSPPQPPMHQNSTNWGEFVGFPALKNALLRSVITPMLRSTHREEGGEVRGGGGGGGVGGGMPSGVLIHGPTGCGKTALACAIASAAGASLLHVSCPRLLSKYVGDSEAGIRLVFKAARAASPCVLLLDDLDAIAGARGGGGSGGGLLNSLVATLLTEMEGVSSGGSSSSGSGSSSTPILVIATCTATATAPAAPPPPPPPSFPTFTGTGDTAQKKVEGGDMRGSVGVGGGGSGGGGVSLDAALLRPGRLEVHIAMPLPDTHDRLCILRASPLLPHLSPPLSLQQQGQGQGKEQDQGYSVEELAGDLTAGWSCAQVSALLGEAAMVACLESEEEREGEEVEGGDARVVSPFSAILKPHLDQAMVALCKQSHLPNHYSRA